MKQRDKIHGYKENYEDLKHRLQTASSVAIGNRTMLAVPLSPKSTQRKRIGPILAYLSPKNRDLILSFDLIVESENCGFPRRLKILNVLLPFCRELGKDLDSATKEDIKKTLSKICNRCESIWTASGYKSIVRKFYKWLVWGDNYKQKNGFPDIVNWLRPHVPTSQQPKVKASEILTEEEVRKMIDCCDKVRDKCFLAVLYEWGFRVSAIGNTNVGDFYKGENGAWYVDVQDKTGNFSGKQLVISAQYVTEWLRAHPLKNRSDFKDCPMFVNYKNERVGYNGLKAMLVRASKSAGIAKKVWLHGIRHARVTHLEGLSDIQMKMAFNWTKDSRQLETYSHLTTKNLNDAMLGQYGLDNGSKKEPVFRPVRCECCGEIYLEGNACPNGCVIQKAREAKCTKPKDFDKAELIRQLIEKL